MNVRLQTKNVTSVTQTPLLTCSMCETYYKENSGVIKISTD